MCEETKQTTPDYRDIILNSIYGEEYVDFRESKSDLIILGLVKWLSIDDAKRFCEVYELNDKEEQ